MRPPRPKGRLRRAQRQRPGAGERVSLFAGGVPERGRKVEIPLNEYRND